MDHLKFLWLLLTGRLEVKPREHWITARHVENQSLWHGEASLIPPNYIVLVSHPSRQAMVSWVVRSK